MTIEEAINLSKTKNILAKGSVKAAQKMLYENEEVKYAINGNVSIVPNSGALNSANALSTKNKLPGVVVITNRRIFFCSSVLGDRTEKEINLDKIESIDSGYSVMLGSGQLRVKSLTEMLVIDSKTKVITEMANIVKSLISEINNVSNTVNNASNISTADEIRKYKELLDCGAITEEEFNAKKKELLNL